VKPVNEVLEIGLLFPVLTFARLDGFFFGLAAAGQWLSWRRGPRKERIKFKTESRKPTRQPLLVLSIFHNIGSMTLSRTYLQIIHQAREYVILLDEVQHTSDSAARAQ
jgi:hypothetical protein